MDYRSRTISFFSSPHRICPGQFRRRFSPRVESRRDDGFRELDHAMLRRLEKRVLVDLPSKAARQAMFQQLLPPTVIRESNGLILEADLDYNRLAQVCSLCVRCFPHL